MDELKKQAEELGIKIDGRWSEDRLREEIDQKLSTQPEQEQEPEVEAAESITITSLIENPMRAFGLTGKGSTATIRLDQLDKELSAKIRRAVDIGFIEAAK